MSLAWADKLVGSHAIITDKWYVCADDAVGLRSLKMIRKMKAKGLRYSAANV